MRTSRYFCCFSGFPFFSVSGSVAPRTYYTNCSFPKSDCQQKAGNQPNIFNWNFHCFGLFLAVVVVNLFAFGEVWHLVLFLNLNWSCKLFMWPSRKSLSQAMFHGGADENVSLIILFPVCDEIIKVFTWSCKGIGQANCVNSSVQNHLLRFPQELLFYKYA